MMFQYSHTGDIDVDEDGLDDDALKNTLSRVKFEHFRDKIGMVQKDLPPKGGVVMLQWDCIILGHMSKSDSETSVFENEEGLYHPETSIHNRSDDLGPRECGRIASSLDIVLK